MVQEEPQDPLGIGVAQWLALARSTGHGCYGTITVPPCHDDTLMVFGFFGSWQVSNFTCQQDQQVHLQLPSVLVTLDASHSTYQTGIEEGQITYILVEIALSTLLFPTNSLGSLGKPALPCPPTSSRLDHWLLLAYRVQVMCFVTTNG